MLRPNMYLILILLVAGVVTVWGQQEQIIDAEKSTLINYEMKKSTGIQWANGIMTTNQSKYDVAHYKIILDLDVDNKLIFGNVTTTALVLDTIDQLELNLRVNMIVDSIKLGSKRLFFSHKNDILTVNLDQTYSTGQSVIIRVDYHGSPSPSGFGPFAFDEYNGEPMIWSLSEPFGAHSWWPCKDIPSDKADSVDIFVKVPANLMAVSNGLLVSESIQGNKKTVHWFEKYPMSTYLVSVAVHPYSTFSDSLEIVSGTTMPIDYYVFQDKLNDAKAGYAKTKQMLQVFSELFGAYPFYDEKYGHAQFLGRANMEHQTISSLRVNASELVIAHELAHQWFGDLITCHNFGHIWLNEGFATYAEALWNESVYGIQAYRNRMEQNQYFEGGTIFVTQMDVSTIFNYNRSYRKASWVLHMLRHVVGDSTFFEILKSYTASSQFRFKTATTEQFQQFCEEKSGQDLSGFFHQWIHEEFYPRYVYDFMVKDSSGFFVTSVEILQEQTNTVIFEMPIDVQFRFVTGDTTIQIKNHLARQNYHFVFHRAPMQCILDPDNWILKNVSQKTHVDFLGEEIEPEAFVGLKSYPNPFSKQTKININLLESVTASVTIYNSLGQQVNTLYEGKFPRGDSSLFWSGQNKNGIYLTPGIYFCKFEHPGFSKTIKLLKQ